jgi:hypothetical protein
MSNAFYQKVEGNRGNNFFPVVFSPSIFDVLLLPSRFGPFLCMRSSKTPLKYFLKPDLKSEDGDGDLKKSPKKKAGSRQV